MNERSTMTQAADTPFVGIDWGTTHRRVYALNPQGVCTQTFADDEGALACKGRFAEALDAALQRLQAPSAQVLLSGMVGSALGWQEVPYVDGSVALADLPRHLVRVREAAGGTTGSAEKLIVPGYCVRNAWGQPDVMRGEETQLLGAWALGHHSGWFVLPGTHSKWVELQAGRIVQLRTYMTGELFDLLGRQGTVAAAAGSAEQVWDAAAFAQGVQSAAYSTLSHQLFGCRARVVCGDMPASSARSNLSGLLIGAELHDVLHSSGDALRSGPVHFLGAPELARHYLAAAQPLQLRFEVLDAQAAYLAALAHIQSTWKKR
jgi:2-dehydro-3-deoxygalactonokinase